MIYGDGPLRKWIQKKAKDVDHLKLMGFTSDRNELADIMASSDYFVHGSSAETFGLVVAEAICSGLPVVVPKTGGAVDLSDPAYAVSYKTGSSTHLSNALNEVLKRNRNELAKNAMKAAEKKIKSVDDHFKMLFECYETLLQEKNKGVTEPV